MSYEAEVVRPATVPGKSVKVASLIPHGNDMQVLHLPRGAAGADTLGILSALFALFGISLLSMNWYLRPTRVPLA